MYYNVHMAVRSATSPLTLRVDRATRLRLDKLARATARTRAFLASEALTAYLDQQEWQTSAIEAGVAAADAGDMVSDDAVTAWLQSWGKKSEKGPPR